VRVRKGELVKANSQEHLNRVLSDVMRDPPRTFDRAIWIVLKKLSDPEKDSRGRTATEATSSFNRDEDQLLARYATARERALKVWLKGHAREAEQIEDHVRRTASENEFVFRGTLMQELTKASGFPDFEAWLEKQAVPA
jgi:hypothetical protein